MSSHWDHFALISCMCALLNGRVRYGRREKKKGTQFSDKVPRFAKMVVCQIGNRSAVIGPHWQAPKRWREREKKLGRKMGAATRAHTQFSASQLVRDFCTVLVQ